MRCYRIRFSDLAVCEVEGANCRKSKLKFPEAVAVAKMFKGNGNLKLIRDGNFLMGEFRDGKVEGKRICILPDGTKLNKAYSLFAPRLAVHDERSHGHWDVIFENPNGELAYVYSIEKAKVASDKKYIKVDEFEKCLPRLRRNLIRNLGVDDVVLPMLILLKTRMRVGSEIYYLKSGHKGLTTLKKEDLSIDGNKVVFNFVGKDGVPQKIIVSFSEKVINELRRVLKKRKVGDFVFSRNGKTLKDIDFEKAFERYCGERFYPHIVRSHFATREVETFLRNPKKDVRNFCLGLAEKLGHKKFSKKSEDWEGSFEVTLHYYVRPDLVKRIRKLL